MKKILIVAMACIMAMACNNSTDTKKEESPGTTSPATGTDTSSAMGDTSSYERMPNSPAPKP